MTDHETTREELLDAMGLARDEELSAEALTHLSACASCTEFAESLAALDIGLMDFAEPDLPPGLLERTFERFAEEDAPPAALSLARPSEPSGLGLFAALLEAIVVGLFTWPAALFVPVAEARRAAKQTQERRRAERVLRAQTSASEPKATSRPEPEPAKKRSRWPLLLALPAGATAMACLGLGGLSLVTLSGRAPDRSEERQIAWQQAEVTDSPAPPPPAEPSSSATGGYFAEVEQAEAEVDLEGLDAPSADNQPTRPRVGTGTGGGAPVVVNDGSALTDEDGRYQERIEARSNARRRSRRQLGRTGAMGRQNANALLGVRDSEEERNGQLLGQGNGATPADPAEAEPGRFNFDLGGDGEDLVASATTPVSNIFDTALANGLNAGRDDSSLRSERSTSLRTQALDGLFDDRGGQVSSAAQWLLERDRREGHAFQAAEGYWANTYVPGDARMRQMRHRLAQSGSGALQGSDRSALALAEDAEPNRQHLDPPRNGALALRLTADRATVEGPQRVLLQVGIRGAARRAGRRPTLRVNVVLDLRRPLDVSQQANVRALLTELSRARTGADRMGLVIVGPTGGVAIPLSDFRYGVVAVALDQAFASERAGSTTALSLDEAMRTAVDAVGLTAEEAEDDTLGSGLVLVVSPGLDSADADRVASGSHAGVLAGVTTTAVGLSGATAIEPFDRVALAGAGRRRILSEAAGARELVRAEINAVSRVVARAVRLRVRLAPGVQLIDVLGSHRLDSAHAERVREAEQAVDQQLSRRLGISADRGEDEDGIQVVIPAFYTDDSHVVLLDVVVPGAGPIADVSLRFKDLLTVSNNSANARLSLPRGNRTRGPREHAVLRNLLAHELSRTYEQAAADVSAGRPGGAITRLEALRALLSSAPSALPAMANDRTLQRDVQQIDRFRSVLGQDPSEPTVVDCFNYASHRRLNFVSEEFE